ncbi:hypothetical protein ABEB36_002852 [Hypothenemus hampei]|uniref:Nose resistant-to-fluoxetine protein N-terminal domain-containing protein n=1 Tax=Hypothenemus hampei TaxID=57062 RepID=A0ABD1F781_HYPHA
MRSFSYPFLAVLYFVVTNIRCVEKTTVIKKTGLSYNSSVFNSGSNSTEKLTTILIDSPPLGDLVASDEELGKICLKNITKCMEEDNGYHATAEKLLNYVFALQPPFDLSRVSGVSLPCQKDSLEYIQNLKSFKLWALKMYDSSAKLPSGLLNGNVNQLGDFDMCLQSISDDETIKGKYCLPSIEVQVPKSTYLAGLHRLLQSHYHFKSVLEDPGHRVPRFSSINWAVCVPNSCSSNDINIGLKNSLGRLTKRTKLNVRVQVDPTMCHTLNEKDNLPFSTKLTIMIFSGLLIFEIFASIYENFALGEKNQYITSFSLAKNITSLFIIKKSPGDLQAVHGIRMINAILLVLAHKSMAVLFLPYFNRTEAAEYLGRPFSVIGRAASLYTDPFIMISGLLTSYSLMGKLEKSGKINILQEYMSRLYRILPNFAALIAFCTFILPWLNDGPMWNLVVTHHSDICKKYWWRNMLFIHNYFGFQDMCLTHTHHLGIDTQLFFVAPFMVYGIWKWPKKGSAVLLLLAVLSTVARYYVTYTMQLSNYVHFGTSVKQLFSTADNMYILPAHRATVYIMGIFLGYLLRKSRNVVLTKTHIRMGNTFAVCSFLVSYLGPAFMGKIDYIYSPTDAAWYAAFSPIFWVASFCWLIYTIQLGHTRLLSKLLSHPICMFWTKISYTVYLTQFPVFFYNVGITRSVHEFGFFTKMLNLQEFVWILGLSVALSVVFEMPFQNLRTLLLKKTDKVKISIHYDTKKHS